MICPFKFLEVGDEFELRPAHGAIVKCVKFSESWARRLGWGGMMPMVTTEMVFVRSVRSKARFGHG